VDRSVGAHFRALLCLAATPVGITTLVPTDARATPMAGAATVLTTNKYEGGNSIWVTIYDLGKTQHMDWGCVYAGEFRKWQILLTGKSLDDQLWTVRPPLRDLSNRLVRDWARRTLEAAGYEADIVGLDGDPLTDITAVTRAAFVMKGGKVYKFSAGTARGLK